MALAMDPRLCAEANMIKMEVWPNVKINALIPVDPKDMSKGVTREIRYVHQIVCRYEQRDSSDNLLGKKDVRRDMAQLVVKDSDADINDKIDAEMYEWVRTDKLALTGVDIGPKVAAVVPVSI